MIPNEHFGTGEGKEDAGAEEKERRPMMFVVCATMIGRRKEEIAK